MKLFLLKARDDLPRADNPWLRGPFDDSRFYVLALIRATSEHETRQLANECLFHHSWARKGYHRRPWLDEHYSTCEYLGEAAGDDTQVVLTDFR